MSTSHARFLALTPDPRFAAAVKKHKGRVRETVGPQMYLDDPPHVTLYLAVFTDGESLLGRLARSLGDIPTPRVEVTGWHRFANDPLTGHQTLVFDFRPEDREVLRQVQAAVVAAAAPLRDCQATAARFADRLDKLSPEETQNVSRIGFPFFGAGWHPHVTVASIRSTDWPAVERDILPHSHAGPCSFPVLHEYDLIDGKPVEVGEIHLAAAA
ncbi:MAG TPA: 2'-5' RNA ligase family protein [Fimbriiglobus sp.]|jgi:2'-5' RNA ligase